MAKTMVKKKETLLNSSLGGPIEVSQGQEFYRPKQVAELLGISMRTYYTMVSRGKLHPVKLSERVTVVARKEIFCMIETALGETLSQSIFSKDKRNDCKGKDCKGKANEGAKTRRVSKGAAKDRAPVGVTHDTHYTMAEVCSKFDYSYGRLYTLRMRYQISAVHAFGTTCYPKDAIDKAMSEERERLGKTLGEHWYTCGELMRIYGLGKTQVRRFANTHNVRTRKANGNRLYYLKEDWEAERRKAEDKSCSTKEKREGAS
jgi:predicted DNA-binding transcriptional regulator AlpA